MSGFPELMRNEIAPRKGEIEAQRGMWELNKFAIINDFCHDIDSGGADLNRRRITDV